MKALEGERAGLLRDVALRQEMEAQYAKRGTLQVGAEGCTVAFVKHPRLDAAGRSSQPGAACLKSPPVDAPPAHCVAAASMHVITCAPSAAGSWLIAPPLQAREIRSARTKITSLEKGLVRMAADFEQVC